MDDYGRTFKGDVKGIPSSFGITMDGGGSAITTGAKGFVTIPFACQITGWYIVADVAGSIVVDIWKAAGAVPTVANSIAGSEKPTLSSGTVANDVSLTTWTTLDVAAGDVIGFNVDSVDTVTKCTLSVKILKA